VNIYDLNTFELQRQLLPNKHSANIFAIDTHIEISEDESSKGIPMIVTRLAVGARRKLFVFTWRDTEFTNTQVSEDVLLNTFFFSKMIYLFSETFG